MARQETDDSRVRPGLPLSEGELVGRWPGAWPFLLVGSVAIIAGGLVAAISRPTDFELGSWVAAYLVLVGGVAQIGLGVGQALMADRPPVPDPMRIELVSWNLAVVLTIAGTLADSPALTTIGGVATVVALVSFLGGVRRGRSRSRWPLALYRALAVVVLVSTPIGLVLSWTRHG